MQSETMIGILEQMLALWKTFDIDAYEEFTGDDEAASRVAGTLRGMIADLRDGVDDDDGEGDEYDEEEE